ncbi:aminotransferase class IV family protein [Ensifer soli]|uniref:aminotransferase class IV family protein n=1 Tax=Ciceribacter sp. sgz301302 TaxID=3342379 RepID=UPI0035B9A136
MTAFDLIETMRFSPDAGIVRLRLHLERLRRSARRLGFEEAEAAEARLAEALGLPVAALWQGTADRGGEELRVRLTLSREGAIAVTSAPFTPLTGDAAWSVAIAQTRLGSGDRLLRHKTTRRAVYERARAERPASEADEMILLNERGEVCEGTITSVFLDDGSGWLKTPPIACGLLAGVLRTELICARRARTGRILPGDLAGGRLFVGNSLRGLIPARLVSA